MLYNPFNQREKERERWISNVANEFSFFVFTITHKIHEHPLTCQDKNIGNRFFIYRIPSKWSKLCTKSPWYAVWSRQTRKTCARKSITTWNRFWFFTADRGENDFAWDSKGAKKRDRRAARLHWYFHQQSHSNKRGISCKFNARMWWKLHHVAYKAGSQTERSFAKFVQQMQMLRRAIAHNEFHGVVICS